MLEQQQGQLVTGLQEMYHRMLAVQQWQGPVLSEATGQPLTHDILSALGLLEKKGDGSDEMLAFEEDCEKLQSRLLADGAVLTTRKGSLDSDSDRELHAHDSSPSTPAVSKSPLFPDNFSFGVSAPPVIPSPAPRQRKSYPPAVQSPLHQNLPMNNNDPQLYQAEWALASQTLGNLDSLAKGNMATKTPYGQQNAFDPQDFTQDIMMESPMDSNFDFGDVSFPQLSSNGFGSMQDFGFGGYDQMMEVDFKNFIATA